jgi:hypothetical protein
MQLLLKQSAAAIDKVAEIFYLSEGEKHLLMAADVGEGLLFAGQAHAAIRVIASPDEHDLATTRPQDREKTKVATELGTSVPERELKISPPPISETPPILDVSRPTPPPPIPAPPTPEPIRPTFAVEVVPQPPIVAEETTR